MSSGRQRPAREAFTFLFRDALLFPEPHQRSGKPLLHFLSQCFEHLGRAQVANAFFRNREGERESGRDEWLRFRCRFYGVYIELQCVSQLCM